MHRGVFSQKRARPEDRRLDMSDDSITSDPIPAESNRAANNDIVKIAAVAVVFLVTVVVLYYGKAVVMPVVLAVLLTYALEPFVRHLTRLGIPRFLAAALAISAVVGAGVVVGYQLRTHAAAVIASLPDAMQKVRDAIALRNQTRSNDTVDQLQKAAKELEKTVEAVAGTNVPVPKGVPRVQVAPPGFSLRGYLWSGSWELARLIGQAVVLTFLVYFLLAAGDLYKRKLVRMVGSELWRKRLTVEVLNEIDAKVERFFLVQMLSSALVAVVTWLALAWMNVENAAVWGVAAGILNSIPYFGAILVSVGLALVAFLQFGTPFAAFQVAMTAFAITTLEGMLLTPALMGRAAGINQVAMFVSLLFWGWMWGIVGTLLAVPIMMMVKTVCERVDGLQGVGELLSER